MTLLLLLIALTGQHEHGPTPPTPQLLAVTPTMHNETMPGRSIEWLQEAPNIEDIWWYVYRVYIDDQPAKQLSAPYCKGTYRPFQCAAPLPNLTTTAGKHTLRLTVSRFWAGDSVQHPSQTSPESPKSNPAEFHVRQPPPQMYIPQPISPVTQSYPPVIVK